MRNLSENTKNITGQNSQYQYKEYIFNYKDGIPDTTIKELTENQKYLLNQKGIQSQDYLFNYKDGIPDTTIKELTENQKYL